MARQTNSRGGPRRESRADKAEKFQSFSRPKLKITRTSASGKAYIDYKDTESLKKVMSGNGKILSRSARAPTRWSSGCSPALSAGHDICRCCRTSVQAHKYYSQAHSDVAPGV